MLFKSSLIATNIKINPNSFSIVIKMSGWWRYIGDALRKIILIASGCRGVRYFCRVSISPKSVVKKSAVYSTGAHKTHSFNDKSWNICVQNLQKKKKKKKNSTSKIWGFRCTCLNFWIMFVFQKLLLLLLKKFSPLKKPTQMKSKHYIIVMDYDESGIIVALKANSLNNRKLIQLGFLLP